MQEISALNEKTCDAKEVTFDELLNNSENYSVYHLCFDYTCEIGGKRKYIFSTPEHPLVYSNFFLSSHLLDINKEYYFEHLDEVKRNLIEFLKINNSECFILDEEIYNIEYLKALCANKNVKKIRLPEHILTVEEYEIIKNSSVEEIDTMGVVPELSNVFGEKISINNKKQLLGYNTYSDLIRGDTIRIKTPISDDELEYLKYINDDSEIIITEFDDYENINKILNRLKELNKLNNVSLIVHHYEHFNYKNKFNEYIINHPEFLSDFKDINIGVGLLEKYKLDVYYEHEKRLMDLVAPALNLSPFEKYIYAYNIVKQFKKYKENEENSDLSRHLYDVLDGEYMVCFGYANLLNDLLNKLGIPSNHYGADVDIGLDEVGDDAEVLPDDVLISSASHARLEVYLQDPKYNLDGYYLTDPTWDNNMENDVYNHAIMTHDEYNGMSRYNFLYPTNVNELFFVNNIEEFYQKVNIYLDKHMKKNAEFNKNYLNNILNNYKDVFKEFMEELKKCDSKSYEHFNSTYSNLYRMNVPASNIKNFQERMKLIVKEINNPTLQAKYDKLDRLYFSLKTFSEKENEDRDNLYIKLMSEIIDKFKDFDNEMYDLLNAKYEKLKGFIIFSNKSKHIYKLFQEFIGLAGEHIVNKVNKPVSGEIIMSAVREVYLKTRGVSEEDIDQVMDNLIEVNKERQRKAFPTRYMIQEDGTRVPVLNEHNKFDIESDGYKLSR